MGAWGSGVFENDSALDWMGDLNDSDDPSLLRKKLEEVISHSGSKLNKPSIFGRILGRRASMEQLDADVCSEALVAAELVVSALGHPPNDLPDSARSWLEKHSSTIGKDLVKLAVLSVQKIRADSELKELWEEGESQKKMWHSVMADLEKRLRLAS
jgi:hypothetical protein